MINNNEGRKKIVYTTSVSLTGALKIRQTIDGLIKKKKKGRKSKFIYTCILHQWWVTPGAG